MDDNVIKFTPKSKPETPAAHMFTLDVYMTSDESYEVTMEINECFDDETIGDALFAAAMKFAVEHDQIMELSPEEHLGLIEEQDNDPQS